MKHSKTFQHIVFICFALFIAACSVKKKEVTRAFYYWKTDFKLSESDGQVLQKLSVNKLYVKIFDVDWNSSMQAALPISKTTFSEKPPVGIAMVPVVYITNKSLINTPDSLIERLAHSILYLVTNYETNLALNAAELQIDCDWTVSTKEKYFKLLQTIKSKLHTTQVLSATIRLHQIKYTQTCGIPPVDRGMLMFYNMGKIESTQKNSIFNVADAENYSSYISQYQLPLDIVLPVFSWVKVFRNRRLVKLLNNVSAADLDHTAWLTKESLTHYKSTKSDSFNGFNVLENDELIVEEISPKNSLIAAKTAEKYFKFDTCTVALYHLNTIAQKQYETNDFERIYACFE